MEVRVRDLARTKLGSASFVDLRLPEGQTLRGQSVVRDTLAIHVHPRILRPQAEPPAMRTGACRRRLSDLAHVGIFFVGLGDLLYVAYLNPADDGLLERARRIRAQGYLWLCLYDVLGSFGMTRIAPLGPDFLEVVLEVRDEAKRVSNDIFERAADEVDWTLKYPDLHDLEFPIGDGEAFRGTICTSRTPRPPQEADRETQPA